MKWVIHHFAFNIVHNYLFVSILLFWLVFTLFLFLWQSAVICLV